MTLTLSLFSALLAMGTACGDDCASATISIRDEWYAGPYRIEVIFSENRFVCTFDFPLAPGASPACDDSRILITPPPGDAGAGSTTYEFLQVTVQEEVDDLLVEVYRGDRLIHDEFVEPTCEMTNFTFDYFQRG